MADFDPKKVSPVDWGVIGGGALALIAMFMPWYGIQSACPPGAKCSFNAWSAGFAAWFGCLLLVAAGAVVLMRVLGQKLPDLPVGAALLALGLAGLGTVLILLRVLTFDAGSVFGVEFGRKIGSWLGLLAGIAATAAAFMSFQASGEPLSWGATGSRGAVPPAPGGPGEPPTYAPPPAAPVPPAPPAGSTYAPPPAPAAPPPVAPPPVAPPTETGGPPPPASPAPPE